MNIDRIRTIAKIFLHMPVLQTEIDFIVSHPFTNSWMAAIYDNDGNGKFVCLQNDTEQAEWIQYMERYIEEADLHRILIIMNHPYILTFLHCIEQFLSDVELGEVLNSQWVCIENITGDKNVSGKELVEWFKRADKKSLMDEDDFQIYISLPEKVSIYRGVTAFNSKKTKALSWTLKREQAEWFAKRFKTGTGQVWEMTVPKSRILCCLTSRGEDEVIVNLYGYRGKKEIYSVE